MRRFIITLIASLFSIITFAFDRDSVVMSTIRFEVNSYIIDCKSKEYIDFAYNFLPLITKNKDKIDSIIVISSSSPEGNYAKNIHLSEMRGKMVRGYLYGFKNVVTENRHNNLDEFNELRGKYPNISDYELFKQLRYVRVIVTFKEVDEKNIDIIKRDTVFVNDAILVEKSKNCVHYPLFGVKTNLLADLFPYSKFDLSFTPNIQIEWYTYFYGISVEFSYLFPWWRNDKKHKYFQILDGCFGIRKYFKDSYDGHYIGVYGNSLIYDLSSGASLGYQGEGYGFGISYGYVFRPFSLKAIKLEPYIRIGYIYTRFDKYDAGYFNGVFDGKYYYITDDFDCVKRRFKMSYFGPTMIGVNITCDLCFIK